MTPYKFILFLILFCTITAIKAQSSYTSNQEKISNLLSEYFTISRENIHIQLNKTVYLTNEQIWFKGYIIDKKNKLPYYETTNVYVALFDENGQKIQSQLFYAENSIFQGNLKLGNNFKTGKYHLQVYTNFMNNFSEDESSTYEISIINTEESNTTVSGNIQNYDTAEISFYPEGGTFLEGVSNTIGIKIIDCNGQGIAIKNGEIHDAKGNLLTNFSTNAFGYGKFEIKETEMQQYKAVCTINDHAIGRNLPFPVAKGITFSVDNYIIPGRTTIKVKTNPKSLEEVNKSSYSLVIQQNDAASFIDFNFKNNLAEQTFTIANDKVFDGINTIHLIDANLVKMGERVIYKSSKKPSHIAMMVNQKRNDSIVISGTSKIPFANLSISVLPAASISNNAGKTMSGTFEFDSYLSHQTQNTDYYFNDFSRRKQYELDNYLLAQHSKYEWNAMLSGAPKLNFDFDKGLTVKGTVNTELKNIEQYKINMKCVGLGLDEFTSLNAKSEFVFEHVVAIDSTKLYFVILNPKGEKSPAKTYCQLLNNNRRFTKPYTPNANKCPVSDEPSTTQHIAFPKIQNAIALDSITIKAQKNKLNHENTNANKLARGYKISDKDIHSYRDIIQFLSHNGFRLNTVNGNVTINGYNPNSLDEVAKPRLRANTFASGVGSMRSRSGPAVFIDNIYVRDYNELRDYGLETIDEIYINRENNYSMYGTTGTINIYSKKSSQINNLLKNKSQALAINNGFQKLKSFENLKYDNVKDAGFAAYGTVDWKQNVFTDADGNFRFAIPNLYQDKVKITLEGMTSEGQSISETNMLDIP